MQIELRDETVAEHLRRRGLLKAEERPRVEPGGDGNINWVRRIRHSGGSWIVKQARPALERFPQYRVSTERIVFEARYCEAVSPQDLDDCCPRILDFDPEARVLVMEDLGEAERLDHALARGADAAPAMATLGAFLGRVHRATREQPSLGSRFRNPEMRRLHGDHIFDLPFRENDFPRPPRVAERAARVWADRELVEAAASAHRRYLGARQALVHGDVQAGNLLLAQRGPVLLDAEIAHLGDPAFDLGTLLAHLLLPAAAGGREPSAAAAISAAWSSYVAAHGREGLADLEEVGRYAGFEMLRRCIGAARLPAVGEEAACLRVLDRAERMIRQPATTLEAIGLSQS